MPRRSIYTWVLSGVAALLVALPVAIVLMPLRADSTTELMARLPAYGRFECLLCHTIAKPTEETSALNPFGVDFKRNGAVWNETLALLNSDGDACSNGFEMGDRDGDGKMAPGNLMEQSNPGNGQDCTVAITLSTWGIIKKAFSGR